MRSLRPRTFRALALACAILIGACAKKPPAPLVPPPSPEPDLTRARALVIAGCYTCLREAFDLYQSVHKRFPTVVEAADGAALTALVLAVRERELGTTDSGYLERARQLADASSDKARIAALADVAETVPWAQNARPREESTYNRERIVAIVENRPKWQELLVANASEPAVAYIAAAFDCAWGLREAPRIGALALEAPSEPLLAFAKALCRPPRDPFPALLAREPRLLEIEYYSGLRAVAARRLDEADARLTRALEYYAEWPALTLTLASVAMTAEDNERALELYDRTLAMVPNQQDARLGRTTALSYLGRHEDAIAMADGLVHDARWHLGDAFYWRAWNKAQLNRIEEAWADVTRARGLLVDDKTPKLAGLIAVKRRQYEEAQKLFEEAHSRNPSDCDTKYYLAAVHAELRHWRDGANFFADATACYEAAAVSIENEIEQIRRSDAPQAKKDRIIVKRTKQREDAIVESQTACFNAAVAFFNSANKDRAKHYADRAVLVERFKDKSVELLARIEKMK